MMRHRLPSIVTLRTLLFAALGSGLLMGPVQAGPTVYPLVLDNCGVTVTFEKPPERVVTIKSTAIDMLVALGLGHTVVGRSFEDGEPVGPGAGSVADVPMLSDKLPGQEVVLGVEPDFVYGGWESNFSADGAGERSTLAGFGVNSYVSPAACKAEPYRPAPLRFDDIFAQIAEIGVIFDVSDRAEALIAAQRAQLASIRPAASGLRVLWYSSGSKIPYIGAGTGAPQMSIDALGLVNIMAEIDDSWASASWEAIVDADPEIIILVDAAVNTAERKKALLADNPVTALLEAVQAERYLILPFPAAEAGVRSVPATLDLAAQLEALKFPR